MCRLRVVPVAEFVSRFLLSNKTQSLVTVEYGEIHPDNSKSFYRIVLPQLTRVQSLKNSNVYHVKQLSKPRQFSEFIRAIALHVKNYCFRRASEIAKSNLRNVEKITRFIVVHVRGTDKPCVLKKLKPKNMISKLKKLGVKRESDIVYFMSDIPNNSSHFKALKSYFRTYYFFESSDIDMFDDEIFAEKAPFLIYTTELQLQEIADGIIETYPGHKRQNSGNVLGYLQPIACFVEKHSVRIKKLFESSGW